MDWHLFIHAHLRQVVGILVESTLRGQGIEKRTEKIRLHPVWPLWVEEITEQPVDIYFSAPLVPSPYSMTFISDWGGSGSS